MSKQPAPAPQEKLARSGSNGDPAARAARASQRAKQNGGSHLQHLLTAMVAFRDGNFSTRLPSDWPGLEGRIAEAFNQAIAHEDRISREINRLSESVGKEGRLRQRMSLAGAIGQWATK